MSADRIDQLHQKASEHYLNGDYAAAIDAWKELLVLDPANEQALEGVRMSTMLGEGGDTEVTLGRDTGSAAEPAPATAPEPSAEPAAPAYDAEIEQGLKVFDAMPAPSKLEARAPEASASATQAIDRKHLDALFAAEPVVGDLDPSRQGEGIDFGDIGGVAAIPLAEAARTEAAAQAAADDGAEAVGLDLVGDTTPRAARRVEGGSVAQDALQRRVRDLLDEARARRDEGDRDAALGVVSRIFILDENNAEARSLEAELRDASAGDLAALEGWIIEGVQAFDQGRLDEAKQLFAKVVERVPEHREALHYLDAIAEREAGQGEFQQDLLGAVDRLGGTPLVAAASATPALAEEPIRPVRDRAARPAALVEPAPARRSGLPKWIIAAGLGLAAAAIGFVVLPGLFGRATQHDDPAPAPPRRSSPQEARPGGAARAVATAGPAATTAGPASAAQTPSARSPGEALERARVAMTRGDYGAAVLAYNEAISLDPANVAAHDGIREAGELYKARKVEQEQLESVKTAFRDGEYASALRVLYRLPDSFDRGMVERWKVDGWYNLGIVALRAGETSQAVTHFEEALAILPDEDATRWRAFAQRYKGLPKDRGYYDAVEAIPFKTLD